MLDLMPPSIANMHKLSLLALALAASVLAQAQLGLLPADDWRPRITKDGVEQTLLQLGGLNNPRFNAVDVDGDGLLDYHIFDLAGGAHMAVGYASGTTGPLVDKSSWVRDWPLVDNFALLRDFDGDGVPDLFASSAETGPQGIVVYQGFRQNGRLGFTPVTLPGRLGEVLGYETRDGNQIVYVANTDVPVIEDIDGDGDVDVLSFDPNGTYVYLYRNVASGIGDTPLDHLSFVLESTCYGGLFEDGFTSKIRLSTVPGGCPTPLDGPPDSTLVSRGGLHAGSTLALYDVDGDAELDLLVGDLGTSSVIALVNAPTGGTTFFTTQIPNWPNGEGETPVDIEFLPAVYPLAALGQTTAAVQTVIAATGRLGGEDYLSASLYDRSPDGTLLLRQRDFLTELSFDHGTGTHFATGQLDGQGLEDLIVGNYAAFESNSGGTRQASLRYYQCAELSTCQEQNPSWLQNLNTTLSPIVKDLDPVLADMDGDGDLDLLIGNENGSLVYARNVGTATLPRFEIISTQWEGITVGKTSSPAVGDINGDGLPDLLVGRQRGTLSLYLNKGSRTAPAFSSTADDEFYGEIDLRTAGFQNSANARPALITLDGTPTLYVGSAQGKLNAYDQLPSGSGGKARLAVERRGSTSEWVDPHVGFDEVQQLPVVLVGNRRGGVRAYRIEQTVGLRTQLPPLAAIQIAPNPASATFRVLNCAPDTRVDLYNALGQLVALNEQGGEIITVALPAGVYEVITKDEYGEPFGRARLLIR